MRMYSFLTTTGTYETGHGRNPNLAYDALMAIPKIAKTLTKEYILRDKDGIPSMAGFKFLKEK